MLVSKLYTTIALVASGVSAGLISTWAQDGRMQLAMVYQETLLMGTCADSVDDWVFNQTVALPSDFISSSTIDILYLGNDTGSDVTGLVYQNEDKDIVMIEYHCNGSDIIGPITNSTYHISTLVGFDSYNIKKGTPISATLATGIVPSFVVSWIDRNNTAWQFQKIYGSAYEPQLTQVSPAGFAAYGYTASQFPLADPVVSVYAVNNTELFYNVGDVENYWNKEYDVYGFPKSISPNATTNSTSKADFVDTHHLSEDFGLNYDTDTNCLAITQDPRADLLIWMFWVDQDNQLFYTNNGHRYELYDGAYSSPYNSSAFFPLYDRNTGGSSVDSSYGISVFTDYQRNYSRVYWLSSEIDQLVWSERNCSFDSDTKDGFSHYNETATPLPFQNGTNTDTASTTIIDTPATTTWSGSAGTPVSTKYPVYSHLSTAAKAGIGIGAGLSVVSFISFLIWKLVQRRAKRPKPFVMENIEERYFATDADAIAVDSRVTTPVSYKGPMELSAVVRPVEIATIVREPQEMMGDMPPRHELPIKPLPSLPVAPASLDDGNLLDKFPSPNVSPVSIQLISSLSAPTSKETPSLDKPLSSTEFPPVVESSPSHSSTSK